MHSKLSAKCHTSGEIIYEHHVSQKMAKYKNVKHIEKYYVTREHEQGERRVHDAISI